MLHCIYEQGHQTCSPVDTEWSTARMRDEYSGVSRVGGELIIPLPLPNAAQCIQDILVKVTEISRLGILKTWFGVADFIAKCILVCDLSMQYCEE